MKPKTMDELFDENNDGVEYLLNPDKGCKAILDQPRRGRWKLPVVCGKPRTGASTGDVWSPYCKYHLQLYTNYVPRRSYG